MSCSWTFKLDLSCNMVAASHTYTYIQYCGSNIYYLWILVSITEFCFAGVEQMYLAVLKIKLVSQEMSYYIPQGLICRLKQ